MAERSLKIGARVDVTGKDLQGTVAFLGVTNFAVGRWVGVILDEPKGRNNGSFKGQSYFECGENHGMFVRPTQLRVIGAAVADQSSEDIAIGVDPNAAHTAKVTHRNSFALSQKALLNSRSLTNVTSEPLSIHGNSTSKNLNPSPLSADVGENIAHSSVKQTSLAEKHLSQINNLESESQIEELKTQLNELTGRYAALERRSKEDGERLQELEKLQIQYVQVQELRTKVLNVQPSFQRGLPTQGNQERKDKIELRERGGQDILEFADIIELIALEKEMAEVKMEALQLELKGANERIEELQIDLELRRHEIHAHTESAVNHPTEKAHSLTVCDYKQLEEDNIRLKETLVRLRDVYAHDKYDVQKLVKELEWKTCEINELESTKDNLSSRISEYEINITDMKAQIDVAMHAEELVGQLCAKKLELEELVKSLEQEISQLAALEDVHDQLLESNLREELDLAQVAKTDILQERDAARVTICDRDKTIQKFRTLVQNLNEQLKELRTQNTTNTQQSGNAERRESSGLITNVTAGYKRIFAESKAHARSIEAQLRQIELSLANKHVGILSTFMPASFTTRGGDQDAISLVLLVSRLLFKCGIVINHVKYRFSVVENINKEAVLHGHAVHQYAFKCRFMHYIHNLQYALDQMRYGFETCQPHTLLRAALSLPELTAQELNFDGVLALIKANQLDEHSSTDNLQQCVVFFNAISKMLLASEDLVNEAQLIRDCVASLNSASESILTDAFIVLALLQEDDGASDTALLMQYVIELMEAFKEKLKVIKRRLPKDVHVIKCDKAHKNLQTMHQSTLAMSRIMSVMHLSSKQAIQTVVATIENDNSAEHCIEHSKFWRLLINAYGRICEQVDTSPMQHFKGLLVQVDNDLQQVAQFLLDKEYEILSDANVQKSTAAYSPISQRAQLMKTQFEQWHVLAAKLQNREADIKQLKLAVKMRQEGLSLMQIRRDLTEKRFSLLQNEVENWKQRYNDMCEQLQQKETTLKETMDRLNSAGTIINEEQTPLADTIHRDGSDVPSSDDTSLVSTIGSSSDATLVNYSESSTIIGDNVDSEFLGAELQTLKTVFNKERNDRLRLQAQYIREKLKTFEPIYVPQPRDQRIIQLERELVKLKHLWALSLMQKVPDNVANGEAVPWQRTKQIAPLKSDIFRKVNRLASEILNEYFQRNPHRAATTKFASFPTVDLKHILKS